MSLHTHNLLGHMELIAAYILSLYTSVEGDSFWNADC